MHSPSSLKLDADFESLQSSIVTAFAVVNRKLLALTSIPLIEPHHSCTYKTYTKLSLANLIFKTFHIVMNNKQIVIYCTLHCHLSICPIPINNLQYLMLGLCRASNMTLHSHVTFTFTLSLMVIRLDMMSTRFFMPVMYKYACSSLPRLMLMTFTSLSNCINNIDPVLMNIRF